MRKNLYCIALAGFVKQVMCIVGNCNIDVKQIKRGFMGFVQVFSWNPNSH